MRCPLKHWTYNPNTYIVSTLTRKYKLIEIFAARLIFDLAK